MSEAGWPRRTFVPALGYRFLTPLYDAVVHTTVREDRWRPGLLRQAGLQPGHRVLDLACGTGSLLALAARARPGVRVLGADRDPDVLARARGKLAEARPCGLVLADAVALPFSDGVFDRVLTSLFLHHLGSDAKLATLREVLRVLRPGGELHVADWGRPAHLWERLGFALVRLLDGPAPTRDHALGRVAALIEAAGFADVRDSGGMSTLFGRIFLYRACRPLSGGQAG